MNEPRLRLGDILLESGLITQETLNRALEIQQQRQLRLGTILLQEGLIPEPHLLQALSRHLAIPWVSIKLIDIPDDIIRLVPVNVAEEFFLIPIYVRTEKGGGKALYVAMNDPSDQDALRFVQATSGMPVRPMIAGPSDIAAAIRYYYYGDDYPEPADLARDTHAEIARRESHPSAEDQMDVEDLSDEVMEMVSIESTMPPKADSTEQIAPPVHQEDETPPPETIPAPTPAAPAEETATLPRESTVDASDEAPLVFEDKTAAQREAERRIYGVGHRKPTRRFALTLLDGTTLSFTPAKKTGRKDGRLSREDLLAGLRAAAAGTPMDDFLPAEKWQSYMAALLDILMRKGLVLYDEFYEAVEQIEKKKN